MLVAVILCMLVSLFAILITVGSLLAKTGFAKLWGSVAGGVVAVTAGIVVLSHSSRPAPAPDPSAAAQSQAQGQGQQFAAASTLSADAMSSSQLSASSELQNAASSGSQATADSGNDISTGQLLESVLQALKNGQSIGDDALNQLPADQREQVRAVASTQ